jgi:aminodeoxyfutalosine deaminase
MIQKIHRAKYVCAESDLLLQNGAVHISDPGRISRIERWHGGPPSQNVKVVDWGSAVILPGLVNAHSHLELSLLRNQLTRFSSFTDWIAQLIRIRREWTEDDYLESLRYGAEMSVTSGVTLVGDVSASGLGAQALQHSGLRTVVFEEVLGLAPEKAPGIVEQLQRRMARVNPSALQVCGISPHAPYSVSPELYRLTAETARLKNLPLATHLAETRAELEFLMNGEGEFVGLLDLLGALPADWRPPRLAPLFYLEALGVLEQPSVLIHCNYLDRESMEKALATHASVVYCPRSHAFFGHEKHPVRQLLDMGVNVAMGTDSLASNDSLSILDEMRFLFQSRKDLKCAEILRMATVNGSAALGFGGALGRLRRGYWADMTILKLPENVNAKNLVSQILEGAGECVATIVQGQIVWREPGCSLS